MGRKDAYLFQGGARTIICNGEGEQVFANILRTLLQPDTSWADVLGISYMNGGEIITTAPQPRLENLDDIPSPFLTREIDGVFHMTIFETTRGCPFKCSFCFWGSGYNDRVYKFSDRRVHADIEEIGRMRIPSVFLADANWGMLKRDIDFSQHLADNNRKYKTPMVVTFTSSKNSPDRVTEITRIFAENNLSTAQPISFQTLTEKALDNVQRSNIKLAAYDSLMSDLNDRGIGSFIELMWPLPGETLESFKLVLEELCLREPTSIIVYAHCLLRNTPIYDMQEKYGIVTRDYSEGTGRTRLIVQTLDVSEQEFDQGFWQIYMVKALQNARTLQTLPRYLHLSGRMKHHKLCEALTEFCQSRPDHPFTAFVASSIANSAHVETTNYPTVYLMALQSHRAEFTALLQEFARSQRWWSDDTARLLFELDLMMKPRLYKNAPDDVSDFPFEFLSLQHSDDPDVLRFTLPNRFLKTLTKLGLVDIEDAPVTGEFLMEVRHPHVPNKYMDAINSEITAMYCSVRTMNMAAALPRLVPLEPVKQPGLLQRLLRRA